MARTPKPSDFNLPVDGVGNFVFGRRTMADEIAFQVEYAKITGGAPATEWLQVMGSAIADLRVMTVRNAEGFDVDQLDPLDPETEVKILKVHMAYRNKEQSFRRGNGQGGASAGAGAGGNDPIPVPAQVQPAAI